MIDYDKWIGERWDGKQPAQLPKGTVPFPPVAAFGLAGEVGEVMEHLKKHWRDGKHPGEALLLELGDVLHYLTVISHAYGWSLDDVAQANVRKLEARDAVGTARYDVAPPRAVLSGADAFRPGDGLYQPVAKSEM